MTPMLCFGVVCLSKGDDDPNCGPAGTAGGISMTVMASFVIGFMMVGAAAASLGRLILLLRCREHTAVRGEGGWAPAFAESCPAIVCGHTACHPC
eukprot:SAG31_NODE_1119_length_9813_cov_49.321289_6_plen_95_part_00